MLCPTAPLRSAPPTGSSLWVNLTPSTGATAAPSTTPTAVGAQRSLSASSWFFQGSTYLWATQHNCPALLHNGTAMGDKLWPALLLLLLHRHREAGALDQDNQQKGSVFIFLVGRG